MSFPKHGSYVGVSGTVGVQVDLGDGLIRSHPDALKFSIDAFKYDIGGQRGTYAGVLGQAVTNNDTNYVYLDDSAVLQVNTTGFPTDITYLPLARIVASSGEIVAIHEERVLLASSSAAIGTCRIGYPVDGGIRGGDTSASSNNDIGAVRFENTGDGWNRWNGRPPQNYTSGDLTMRLYCSVASSIGASKGTRWELEWSLISSGESLGTWDYIEAVTFDISNQTYDELFTLDFTIEDSEFDNTKDIICFKLTRVTSHADDDCGEHIYVHEVELCYTGYKVAGQAGQ
jgi:hypothetical protein